MKESEMTQIGMLIARALGAVGDDSKLRAVADEVGALCNKFPVYPHRLSAK
jgi:glycine/serine hydroxymethyltransferase